MGAKDAAWLGLVSGIIAWLPTPSSIFIFSISVIRAIGKGTTLGPIFGPFTGIFLHGADCDVVLLG